MKLPLKQSLKICIVLAIFGLITFCDRMGISYGKLDSEVIFESIATDYE